MLKPKQKIANGPLCFFSGMYMLYDRNGEFVIICKRKQARDTNLLKKSEVTTGGVVSRFSTPIQVLKIYHHEIQIVHQKTEGKEYGSLLTEKKSGTQWLREIFRICQDAKCSSSFFDMTQGTPGRAEGQDKHLLQFRGRIKEPGHRVTAASVRTSPPLMDQSLC